MCMCMPRLLIYTSLKIYSKNYLKTNNSITLGYRLMQSPVSGFQMILMFVQLNSNLLLDIADPYPLFLETVVHELVRKIQVVKLKKSN